MNLSASPLDKDSFNRLYVFLHALVFVAGFSSVFIVGWGGAATVLGQLFGQYKTSIGQIGGVVVILGVVFLLMARREVHTHVLPVQVPAETQQALTG